MVDLRRIVVIFVIGVLFAIFVFSTIDAIYPSPDYTDFCNDRPIAPKLIESGVECADVQYPEDEARACLDNKGQMEPVYDSRGCIASYRCEMCYAEYDQARQEHDLVLFIVSSILGLVAIVIALYMPTRDINEWIATGFMLGGLFTLFFGTAVYFGDMARYIRPVVIFLELALVIFLAYKKLSKPDEEDRPKKRR
ncbi:hypothetical protein H6504_00120 [Candidatus Woesearchaeota archaeon]|nr:hypothetical protein [Candidatus Woesearchaeota archaeon]